MFVAGWVVVQLRVSDVLVVLDVVVEWLLFSSLLL